MRAPRASGPLRQAVAFLTPFGSSAEPSGGALIWFPLVGLGLGAALGGLWRGAAHAWPPLVAAAVVVVADLGVTGLLHLDGLVDAADGLLPPVGRERRLSIMAEPGVGAFGMAVAGAALLLRWAALAVLSPSVLLLAGIWCASRALMALGALLLPYARPEGLAAAFLRGRPGPARAAGVVGLLVAGGCLLAWQPLAGAVSLGCGLVAGAGVLVLAMRRLGGFTGDVLGAAGVVTETVALTVAAARW